MTPQDHANRALRRKHKRIANQMFREFGLPVAESLKELRRSHAATVANDKRLRRRIHRVGVVKDWTHVRYAASKSPYIVRHMETLTHPERRVIVTAEVGPVLRGCRFRIAFDDRGYEEWLAKARSSLTYHVNRYRKLREPRPEQRRAHLVLELFRDELRDASPALVAKWIGNRAYAAPAPVLTSVLDRGQTAEPVAPVEQSALPVAPLPRQLELLKRELKRLQAEVAQSRL